MKVKNLLKVLDASKEVELYAILIDKKAEEFASYVGDACDVPYMFANQKVLKVVPSGSRLIIEYKEKS